MSFRLVSTLGIWDLGLGETLIGRSRACAICFLDGRLSRKHASIQVSANEAHIVDLTSTNGVLVNGRRITGPAHLSDRDQIIIGPCLFIVETDSKPAKDATTSRRADPSSQPSAALIDTDAIERKDHLASPPRHVATAIFAAVSSDDRPKSPITEPASKAPSSQGSERFAPIDFKPRETEAVFARTSTSRPDSSTIKPSDHLKTQTDPLIEAHELAATVPEQPAPQALLDLPLEEPVSIRDRSLAACCDAVQTSLIAMLVAVPIFGIGAGLALHHGGVGLVDGRASLSTVQAPVLDLTWSLASIDGFQQAIRLLPELQHKDATAVAILVLSTLLAGLVFVAVHLLATIVTTILAGGPMWHRRFGLVIIDEKTQMPPTWSRAALRWFLLLLFWPLAAWACLRGNVGIHDRLSACRVIKRRSRFP